MHPALIPVRTGIYWLTGTQSQYPVNPSITIRETLYDNEGCSGQIGSVSLNMGESAARNSVLYRIRI